MTLTIPDEKYEAILKQIESKESPVGIDAGKTHVLILHKLLEIEQRLERLEAAVNQRND
ncbi:hypothetical protein NC796_10625 [Aliifodinibius sp. S!AR15-10]|uniref:hypothetical protein n=1 Tax=Aliifodinibius sp. S!AR15-10 TaxID=2950437 RepID=UPI0028623CD1|nr:hypothetical protein [Aliifodinibius sp. S!AR15-10]MDR8391597.1 hypothetical protein [Aliifodinibius sp. S!AR15-10]